MTFGNKGWGSTDGVSRAIFDAYVDTGGNFIDTADFYSGGRSEELVGSFLTERKLRDSRELLFTLSRAGQPQYFGGGAG